MRTLLATLLTVALVNTFINPARAEELPPPSIEAAVATVGAVRLTPPCESVPTAYQPFVAEPAMQAFRAVTCRRGWPKAHTQAWSPFAEAVMRRESAFCPYLFRGDRPNADCTVNRHTGNQDAGFGQVIWKWAPWLGPQEGIWSRWDIIATPTSSMTAMVALIEHSGRQPWCWTAKLRSGSVCRSAPG